MLLGSTLGSNRWGLEGGGAGAGAEAATGWSKAAGAGCPAVRWSSLMRESLAMRRWRSSSFS